jgi:(2Fe-2S) ferredoxin
MDKIGMSEAKYRIYLCGGPHCSAKGLGALRDRLELELWNYQIDAVVEVFTGSCQDHCDYGPNMIIWPGPYRYAQLTCATLTDIVERHLRDNKPIQHLLATPEMRR